MKKLLTLGLTAAMLLAPLSATPCFATKRHGHTVQKTQMRMAQKRARFAHPSQDFVGVTEKMRAMGTKKIEGIYYATQGRFGVIFKCYDEKGRRVDNPLLKEKDLCCEWASDIKSWFEKISKIPYIFFVGLAFELSVGDTELELLKISLMGKDGETFFVADVKGLSPCEAFAKATEELLTQKGLDEHEASTAPRAPASFADVSSLMDSIMLPR